MKKQFTPSVVTPCSKQWNSFTPTSTGGFCSVCRTNVVDFTEMTNDEILEFVKCNQTRTCGRFRSDQLREYPQKTGAINNSRLKLLFAGSLSVLIAFGVTTQSFAQSTMVSSPTEAASFEGGHDSAGDAINSSGIIKGVVTDENNEPLPQTSIYLKGTEIGTTSDLDGKFTFPGELKEGDVLVFSFLGYETKEYVVPKNIQSAIKIQMIFGAIDILGEVAVDGVYTTKSSGISRLLQKIKQSF